LEANVAVAEKSAAKAFILLTKEEGHIMNDGSSEEVKAQRMSKN
jgi:hypothetical protein